MTGRTAMSFYWGRTLGRAAEEDKPIFEATEVFNHARHPTTKRRSNWNDFQGWCISAQNDAVGMHLQPGRVHVFDAATGETL